MAQVDCTVAKATCTAEEVLGYPTIIFYKNGIISAKYSGEQGTMAQTISCRDISRSGQLFLNDGVWDGKQLANAQCMRDARVNIPRNEEYGYTLWLDQNDPVDNKVSSQQVLFLLAFDSSFILTRSLSLCVLSELIGRHIF